MLFINKLLLVCLVAGQSVLGARQLRGQVNIPLHCIDKIEMIEETECDDVVQCEHSTARGATPHTSPITSPSRRRSARRTTEDTQMLGQLTGTA